MTAADLGSPVIEAARRRGIEPALLAWLGAGLFCAAVLVLDDTVSFLSAWPEALILPLADAINWATDWFLAQTKGAFRFMSGMLAVPLGYVRDLLQWLPWPAVILFVAAVGYAAAGWRLAVFAGLAMAYMLVAGYWDRSMYTLAVVAVAVPISVASGLAIGIWGFRSRRARRVIDPCLDMMQTIPTFAYLIPILALFGLGPVVGMLATAIYAVPPMVRNVMLGLERVPAEIVESGRMSGSTRRQLLWWVEVPTALPTILVGVNQTIMAGLSMVVIAAIVGGFPDIGLEVFSTMKKAEFGESILAGLVIALMAMVLDRVSRGFAGHGAGASPAAAERRRVLVGALGALAVMSLAALAWPQFGEYPASLVFNPAEQMNRAIEWFTATFFDVTSALKTWTLFYFMLPLKIGFVESVRPRFWGFEINAFTTTVYVVIVALGALAALRLAGWRPAVAIAFGGLLYFYGTTGLPWPVFMAIVVLLGWQTGGWRTALLALSGMAFILVTGGWDQAMVSVQLCGAGVIISFLIGASLGIWAAIDDRVSAFLRPINDTLQTMPIFVFLIPGIMVFLVGDFTALVAIVMYATVPSIRYTEHGIRSVSPEIVEAARAFGATRRQLLWQVQLPMALPEIMLGLNQTIMLGLAMIVVAALVGAKGLGQEVMVALTWADIGKGLVSGFSVALLAIVTDRIIQSWSARKKAELGLVH